MRSLVRIINALYCEPWLITPAMHVKLCEISMAHVRGDAHSQEGIDSKEHAKRHGPLASGDYDLEWWQIKDGSSVVSNGVEFVDGIAVFDVSGVVGRKFSSFLNSSGVTSVDVLQRMLTAAADDDRVIGIVFDMDSPGGTVSGTPETAAAMQYAGTRKPTAVYASGMAASAAYWIAAPSHAIYAGQTAMIGSIGVYSAFLDQSRNYEKEGYKVELFKTGKYKGMGISGLPLTDEQRELLQANVDEVFGWFKAAVKANRGQISDDAMQGQVVYAEEAKKLGLIDGVSPSIETALEYVRRNAKRADR